MTRPVADLDVPLPQSVGDLVLASLDPFARMACEHPEACACIADYPAWAAEMAARENANREARTARKETL